MTPKERASPGIINGNRRKRIARGSGRPVVEVNQLLKQFEMMRKMMGNKGMMGRLMGGGGGFPGMGGGGKGMKLPKLPRGFRF
jgi:signal recognition particle subunit SRP54